MRRPHAAQETLQRPLDEYQLVVVDEAHNYRNPDAPTRAAVLRRLLFGRRRDLLLLTATPVNNSLWDLYHLVRFFVRQDARFADRGILSIRERFERAIREDPSSLSPVLLYPVIDATTVKRTRQFVKKHYAGDNITGPDGRPLPIVFPQPRAISVRYHLDDLLPGFFDRLEDALDPDGGNAIAFARYTPDACLLNGPDPEEDARARAMVGLLRSGLLKRFESSAFAFRRTAEKMVREHGAFLDALDAGYVVTTDFMKELSADDDAIFEDVLAGTQHRTDAALYDVERLREVVERDRDLLRALAAEVAAITPDRDPKLRALAGELVEIARQAEREATDAVDEARKRKVLVFSFFEDTVEWIRDYLRDALEARAELGGYRGRVAAVSGSGDLAEVSRQEAVQRFAPVSMEASAGQDADRYDLLISTDVLAEGVNLQQCRHIVNFDMPLIECEPETPTWYPDTLQERVYDFWEAARHDVWADWMHETDPANLQPKVRPLNLRVAEFIRAHAVVDMPEDRVTRALDVLESPWPRREEIMLREWFEGGEHEDAARSRLLVDRILDTGLEPVEPPPPLPPISPEDVRLLCWMGIEEDGEDGGAGRRVPADDGA